MSSPGMRELMIQRWRDPEWASRQRAKIAEGHAKKASRPTWASPTPPSRSRYADKRALTAYIDLDDFQALHRLARKQGKSLSELVRTYIEWGIENDGDGA